MPVARMKTKILQIWIMVVPYQCPCGNILNLVKMLQNSKFVCSYHMHRASDVHSFVATMATTLWHIWCTIHIPHAEFEILSYELKQTHYPHDRQQTQEASKFLHNDILEPVLSCKLCLLAQPVQVLILPYSITTDKRWNCLCYHQFVARCPCFVLTVWSQESYLILSYFSCMASTLICATSFPINNCI